MNSGRSMNYFRRKFFPQFMLRPEFMGCLRVFVYDSITRRKMLCKLIQ